MESDGVGSQTANGSDTRAESADGEPDTADPDRTSETTDSNGTDETTESDATSGGESDATGGADSTPGDDQPNSEETTASDQSNSEGTTASEENPSFRAEDVMRNAPDASDWNEEAYEAPPPGEADETSGGDETSGAGETDETEVGSAVATEPDEAALNENPGPGGYHEAGETAAEAGMAATEAAPATGTDAEGPSVTRGDPASAGASGETASVETGTGPAVNRSGETDEGVLDGPESDEEMPLTDHIEEMMRRLSVVVAVGSVVTVGVLLAGAGIRLFPSAEEIIVFLWDHHVGFDSYRPYVYGPLEFLLTKLKVAGLAGVIVSLPVFVYETYRFMRPGLYPHERRYYLAAVPTSLVLAVVGVAFAHFAVLPAIFQYFIGYTQASAQLAFGLRETFNLILLMMGYMAVVFQIPLFIQLAIMMGLVTRRWLEDRRLIFWGSFLGLSFLVSPDPTGMAPIIVTATMIGLFEGTLALLRWTGS
ncbi:MAG: twin-arginine translocase subunit TatC [Halobaculum sp.]